MRTSPEQREFGIIVTPSNKGLWRRFWFHTPVYHLQGGAHGAGYVNARRADGKVVTYHPFTHENARWVKGQVKSHVSSHKDKPKKVPQTNRGLPIVIQEIALDHQ